jgi:hypothetical protein
MDTMSLLLPIPDFLPFGVLFLTAGRPARDGRGFT